MMGSEDKFNKIIDQIKEQTEVPVFPEQRINVFYTDYVDSLDEATDILEEKFQSAENDNDNLGPFGKNRNY